ncbi:MAG: hypothetical protein PHU85_12145 [Phycisphaerae bacterium]|nr:hypothetical protein [Phycisphaerae bacterium]
MRFATCLAVAMMILPFAQASLAADAPLSVKLTVAERAGFDRVDEPVTFGLPLPAGAVTDPRTLCLLDDAGKPIPASFREAQRWVADAGRPGVGSVRWVHVSCLLSVPAKGSKTITLTNTPSPAGGGSADSPSPMGGGSGRGDLKDSPLKVTADEKAGKATIVTGPVKLDLSANLPGVIESASFRAASGSSRASDYTQVISGSKGSGCTVGGKTFTEVEPGSAKVEVLESGPMRAVVLLTGKFKDSNTVGAVAEIPRMTDEPDKKVDMTKAEEGKNKGPGLMFEARVYAYANSPRVFIDYTFINKLGVVVANKIDLDDLSLCWQMGVPLVQQAWSRSGWVVDSHDDRGHPGHFLIRANWEGEVISIGRPKFYLGVNAAGADAGVAVTIRDFWQMHPKELLVSRETRDVLIGLYPRGAAHHGNVTSQELFIGQARSHRIALLLHDGNAKPEALDAVFAATNVPLFPVAEPAWYCQKTQAWGPIASADADYGDFAKSAKHYDQSMADSMTEIVKNVEEGLTETRKDKAGEVIKSVTVDGYGWMNWGDSFFRIGVEGPDFKDPAKNLSWNGNYYDYGMAMVYQWARTGDWRFLDHGLRAGAYTADVFINHYCTEPTQIGACHYCPPRYHAAIDDGTPYFSEEFNHAKIASVVMRWQMLGDWWARQVMFETFNHAEAMQNNFMAGWRQCRGNGHRLHILWCAYEFTGEQKYVDRASALLKLGVAFIRKNTEFDKAASQRFMVGVALEGMIQSQWIRPDDDVAKTIKFVADYAVDEQKLHGYTGNMAMAYGYLWQQTGEPRYLKTMVKLLDLTGSSKHAKYFGQTFRSTPYALGYLAEAAAKGVKLPATRPDRGVPASTNDMMQLR